MQKFVKIFFIAIISIVAGNSECMMDTVATTAQTVFDLPDNTPGLMKCKQIKKVCGQDKECVHVIVPGTDAENAYNDRRLRPLNAKERADYATSKIGNIYFPSDGTQPSTPEAVEYSCANINNREDSPITEWYMKIFGVIDKNGNTSDNDDYYINAGLDESNNSKRIISYDANSIGHDQDPIIDLSDKKSKTKKQLFVDNFKKIASTSVGRMLLYRILIEIRRHKLGVGATERNIVVAPHLANDRNRNRNIVIGYGDICFLKSYHRINIKNIETMSSVVGNAVPGENAIQITFSRPSALHINLVHEFIHWFHCLRDISRQTRELMQYKLLDHSIGKYYWADLADPKDQTTNEKIIHSNYCWRSSADDACTDFEELRTILGSSPIITNSEYLEGDDLSENSYRQECCEMLRFGHASRGVMFGDFFEDSRVIKKLGLLPSEDYSLVPSYKQCVCFGLGFFRLGAVAVARQKPDGGGSCCEVFSVRK